MKLNSERLVVSSLGAFLLIIGAYAGCFASGNYYAFSFPTGGVAIIAKDRPMVGGDAALATGEAGFISKGHGLAFEGRLLDFLWVPYADEARVRMSWVTLGARYTAFSAYETGARSTGSEWQRGNILYLQRGPDIKVDYQVLGAGVFLRGSFLNWTATLPFNRNDNDSADVVTEYDPYVEAGIWAQASLPTMLGPGLEFSLGVMDSHDIGMKLFMKIDLLIGQRVMRNPADDPNSSEYQPPITK